MKKAMRLTILFLLPAALLLSQSLVEVSKKEQERREKLKGKNVRVVTNADLKSVKRTPAVTVQAAPPAEAEGAEPQEQEYAEARAAERAYDEGGGSPFATAVLPDTAMVENPEMALHPPDGSFAEISVMGSLELELNARNGPGDDIAVYARWAGVRDKVPEGEAEGVPFAAWAGGISYGVMVMDERGQWQGIGRGAGSASPEKFDLGAIIRITRIRIMFKSDNNASTLYNPYQLGLKQYTMGIDAVEALH